jgi:uncharacterized protein (TIGR02246 family)
MKKLIGVMLLTFVALSTSLGQTQTPEKKVEKVQPTGEKVASSNTEQAVIQLEEDLRAAIAKGDSKAYGRIVGDDYVFTNQDAVVRTKAQMVSAYDAGSIKYESVKFDEIKVQAYGDTAVVTGRQMVKGQDNGKNISGQFRYTRVYVKRQGGWQLVATQTTRIPAP